MNRNILQNAPHHLEFLYSRLFAGSVLNTIDLKQFEDYQNRFRDADPAPQGYSKYLDISFWMAEKLMYARRLKLKNAKPLRILDIGTGPGYFPYICSLYGHKVVAMDLDTIPMYNEICRFLKIDRKTCRIEKFQKLPDLGMKFDLITAFMIKFDQHTLPDQWGVDEWRFFVEDAKANQLSPNGRMYLGLNARVEDEAHRKLIGYFLSLGGKIHRNIIDVRP